MELKFYDQKKKGEAVFLFLYFVYTVLEDRPQGMKYLHWKTTEGQPQRNRDSWNEDSLPLRGSWKLSCNLSPLLASRSQRAPVQEGRMTCE